MNLKALKDTPPWEWPEGTEKLLLDLLRDGETAESDRLLAAELAGDPTVINDELAEALLSILRGGERSEELRGQAAISLGPVLEHADLGGFEDAEDVPISEATFHGIQDSLKTLYQDADVPQEVRRRILEASVRAPQDWHQEAVRAAYLSGDESWRLTAAFCMRFVPGFEEQILEALESRNPNLHYEAVVAAGNWEVDVAWRHVAALVTSEETEKTLRLAAIDAVATIRPREAAEILGGLIDSEDEDLAEAVMEAMAMAEGLSEEDDEDAEDDELRH